MSKHEAVYFVGDNQAINRVPSKTRNRGAFSGSLAALVITCIFNARFNMLIS